MRCLASLAHCVVLLMVLFSFSTPIWANEQSKVTVETIQFKSELIGQVLPYNVLLPVTYRQSNKRYQVLYLLHGLFGRYDDWVTRTNLAEYAVQYDLIIVTPEGHDNWYTDSATVLSDKYESYLIRELIADVDSRFRTIKDRRGRGIAGLSMGGYGAFKYGLKYPNHFAFSGSLSGAFDPARQTDDHPGFLWNILRPSVNSVFGPTNSQTRKANDLHQIADNLTQPQIKSLPYFYFDCGLDDGFLETNRELASIFVRKKIAHQYRQLPGGHDWGYWDRQVREVLRVYAELTSSKVPDKR